MATEDKKLFAGLTPETVSTRIRRIIYSPDLKESRLQAFNKVAMLDEKIGHYIDELVELMMPETQVWSKDAETTRLREIISASVYLEVYKRELHSIYRKIHNQPSNGIPVNFYGDVSAAQQVLVSRAPKMLKLRVPDESRKRRYTLNPTSPDFEILKDNKVVRDEAYNTATLLSPVVLEGFLNTYPHLQTLLKLRDYIFNGGRIDSIYLPGVLNGVQNQINELRRTLVEKNIILDGVKNDFVEFDPAQLFNKHEYFNVYMRFINGNEKIRRGLVLANKDLQRYQNYSYEMSLQRAFKSFVELNSGKFVPASNNPQDINVSIESMLQDSNIDFSSLTNKRAREIIEFATTKVMEQLERERPQVKREPSKRSEVARHHGPQKDVEDNTIIIGTLAVTSIAMLITAFFLSPEVQALMKKKDQVVEPKNPKKQVVKNVGEEAVPTSGYQTEVVDINGESYTISFDENFVNDAIETVEKEMEANIRAATRIMELKEPMEYIGKHAAITQEAITPQDHGKPYIRRRRATRLEPDNSPTL